MCTFDSASTVLAQILAVSAILLGEVEKGLNGLLIYGNCQR